MQQGSKRIWAFGCSLGVMCLGLMLHYPADQSTVVGPVNLANPDLIELNIWGPGLYNLCVGD